GLSLALAHHLQAVAKARRDLLAFSVDRVHARGAEEPLRSRNDCRGLDVGSYRRRLPRPRSICPATLAHGNEPPSVRRIVQLMLSAKRENSCPSSRAHCRSQPKTKKPSEPTWFRGLAL